MRLLCFLFLVLVGLAVAGFGWQNQQSMPITVYDRALEQPVWAVVAVAYVLGMLTGWSVVGLVRRSFDAATDFRQSR